MEPGEGALDDPAVAAEPGAVLALAAGDFGRNTPPTELAAVLVVVVAAIGGETLGTAPRTADPASYGRDGVDERDQLGDVIAVAAREPPSERDPGRVDQEVVLGAVSGSINGLGPVSEPPFSPARDSNPPRPATTRSRLQPAARRARARAAAAIRLPVATHPSGGSRSTRGRSRARAADAAMRFRCAIRRESLAALAGRTNACGLGTGNVAPPSAATARHASIAHPTRSRAHWPFAPLPA